MTVIEATAQAMMRPEFVLFLAGRHICWIDNAGKLRDEMLSPKSYARFSAQDLMATTWQVYTRDQVAALLLPAGELAGKGGE